jgi:hypothetical protein
VGIQENRGGRRQELPKRSEWIYGDCWTLRYMLCFSWLGVRAETAAGQAS